jgi:hypothetical protein
MKRWLPRISLCRWAGSDADSIGHFEGWSIELVWLGWIVELCGGRQR